MHLVDTTSTSNQKIDTDTYSHSSPKSCQISISSLLRLFFTKLPTHLPLSPRQLQQLYILMGSGDSRLYKPPTLKKQSWTQGRSRRPARVEQGRFRVLVNKLTNEQLQEYLLSFHSLVEFQRYLQFFQWREREDCIVNTKYLNYQLGKDFCNTSYTARVYIERIPVRLSDIEDIPFPENLYLLLSALQGFEKLYGSVGYFRPTEDLVCMDRDGRVKAWLHADLSRCLPAGSLPEQTVHRREEALQARMVDEIVQMVEENTARDQEPGVSIREYLWRNQRGRTMTFRQAKVEVLAYAEQFHAEIPNYFQSVVGIFDEAADQQEGSSAQPPPFLKNERESQQHEAVENWQSAHGGQIQSEAKMVKGEDYERERVFAHPPPNDFEDRPGSAAYSLGGPIQPEPHYYPQSPTHQQGQNFQFAPYPAEYRSAPQQQSASAVYNINQNPNFKVKFNYHPQSQVFTPSPPLPMTVPHALPAQALPAPPQLIPQSYASPVSPIMHLSTPVAQPPPHPLTIKKVASIPDQTERTLQQKFDAKLVLSSSLKNLLNRNNKLVYSDSTSTYELDEELAEDMVKYLNGQ